MIARISAVAFALAFSVGIATAGADCTMGASAAECPVAGKMIVSASTDGACSGAAVECTGAMAAECTDAAKSTVVSTSTAAAAKSEGCENCTCSADAAVTATTAAAIAAPATGMRIVQTATGSEAAAAAEGSMTKESPKPEAKKVGYENGDKVEGFKLKHAQSGKDVTLEELAGEKATVIIFWNNLCPWVEGGPHAAGDRVREMAKEYAEKGVNVIGIDPGVDKSEEDLITYASTQPFPILVNRDSSMAARFNAQYTPHTFVLDSNMVLQYQGGFDSGARRAEDGNPVPWAQNAVDEILGGSKPTMATTRGTGCSIKWAPGSRPTT